VAQGVGPEFKPQYCIKKKNKEKKRVMDLMAPISLWSIVVLNKRDELCCAWYDLFEANSDFKRQACNYVFAYI
jgi:hypothetical protein